MLVARNQKSKKTINQRINKTTMNPYQEKLKKKMDEYVHFAYRITKSFPIVRLNFLETSYGSLQESKYLLAFSFTEKFFSKVDYDVGNGLAEEIGAMLGKK